MPEDRLYEGGFLLRPSFYKPDLSPEDRNNYVRKQLELDPARFLLVLGTGANGANDHLRLWKHFSTRAPRYSSSCTMLQNRPRATD